MGKGPQYIALPNSISCKAILIGLWMITFLLAPCFRICAQEGKLPVSTAVDSNIHAIDSGRIVTGADTTPDSLASANSAFTDSVTHAELAKKMYHSAKKAAYLSAVLPGLGQAYNKKYWKISIVYAGFGGLGYALYYTTSNFNGYRTAYRLQVATVPNPNASFNSISDAASLKAYRDYFKKYVDISAIGVGVWYLLNIIDATVDAHLMGWNMKDDLSITWNPTLIISPNYNTAAGGLAFTLHF